MDNGTSVQYTCEYGYNVKGAYFRMCTVWNTWNNKEPECGEQLFLKVQIINWCTQLKMGLNSIHSRGYHKPV